MKIVFKIGRVVLVLAMLVLSCKKQSDNCFEERPTAAFLFDYPDTVQVGEVFFMDINYVVENSCGDFGKIDAKKIENTLEVKLFTVYDGCQCEDGFIEKDATYPVTFEAPGTYELKLWVAESSFESHVIFVEE
jgi:hypothetical protein